MSTVQLEDCIALSGYYLVRSDTDNVQQFHLPSNNDIRVYEWDLIKTYGFEAYNGQKEGHIKNRNLFYLGQVVVEFLREYQGRPLCVNQLVS